MNPKEVFGDFCGHLVFPASRSPVVRPAGPQGQGKLARNGNSRNVGALIIRIGFWRFLIVVKFNMPQNLF